MDTTPTGTVDSRFSQPEAGPTPWSDAERALEQAELYWITTVHAVASRDPVRYRNVHAPSCGFGTATFDQEPA